MARRATAADQLSRILQLLPLAVRRQGVTLDQLARELGIEHEDVVAEDLHAVATRAEYHLAGPGENTQVIVEADRVYVWTTGEFKRPARFSPAESLALGLGLRVLAAERDEAEGARILALAERLESTLSGVERERWEEHVALATGPGSGAARAALLEAARSSRRCELLYLKAGAERPERREVEPYVAVVAGGVWYVLARCRTSDGVRAFRLDRIVSVVPGEQGFEVPADFSPEQHLREGRVFRAAEETEVVVRYSPRIARWIVEKGPAEPCEDGSVVVRHRVADPRWIVRHVLQYGPDAEILEPPAFRERVREAVRRVRGSVAAG